jgi:uncharacterized protein YbjT (DUF2867 family)
MKKVLVLGGSGFVGRHVCEQLTRAGIRVTVPTRRARNAQTVQTLPQVDVIEANIHDEAALRRLLPGHDAVVNLIGILHGSERQFQAAHVTLAKTLAQAMQATGVRRLVQVSALGASPEGPSRYQRTKAEAEAALRHSGLDLTVLRPSVIFGAGDSFLNLFARLQSALPIMLLPGAEARLQPVWVGDLARAVVTCLRQCDTVGQTYEIAGPQVYTLRELVELAGRLSGHPRRVVGLPMTLGYFQALLLELMPGPTLMSTDNFVSLEVDNVAGGLLPGLAELGIAPSPMEPIAAGYLDALGQADPLLTIRRRAGRG